MRFQAAAVSAIGKFEGAVSRGFESPGFLAQLADLADLCSGAGATVMQPGRNRLTGLVLQHGGHPLPVAIKSFGRRSPLVDRADRRRGSRARRSWLAARYLQEHGMGTPRPIAFLDRWEGDRLAESHYVSQYVADLSSFKDELIRIFTVEPETGPLMAVIRRVACAVRAMHDAGFRHNDLGNQNILLAPGGGEAGDVLFIDLNRSVHGRPLGERARARDISRIWLPSDFLRAFKDMYFAGPVPTRAFQRWESAYRSQYALHAATRGLRHPGRRGNHGAGRTAYPPMKDIWIWDERSGQALIVMQGREKRRHYPLRRHLGVLRSTTDVPRVLREYRALKKACFSARVLMQGKVGLAVDLQREKWQRQQVLLERIGRVPLLVRFGAHRDRSQHAFAAEAVRALHAQGHPVSLSLTQDRRAVNDPARWRDFVAGVLDEVGTCVEDVEAGHAVNRVKWGIWHPGEYRRLIEVAGEVLDRHPGVGLLGPATIDFDPLSTAAALRAVPEGRRLDALSLHLYVDRRGAPENAQGPFTALDKFAWCRAMARCAPRCGERLVVSEVNWPLLGTGVYSPVGAPYVSPGVRRRDPSVNEDDYADFMLRYLLLACASGMVDRVYWWRLVARGYGLIDDSEAACWRERPAYRVLLHFLRTLGGATFVGCGDAKCPYFVFETDGNERIGVAYTAGPETELPLTFAYGWIEDAEGRPLRAAGGKLRVGGRPVYVRGMQGMPGRGTGTAGRTAAQ